MDKVNNGSTYRVTFAERFRLFDLLLLIVLLSGILSMVLTLLSVQFVSIFYFIFAISFVAFMVLFTRRSKANQNDYKSRKRLIEMGIKYGYIQKGHFTVAKKKVALPKVRWAGLVTAIFVVSFVLAVLGLFNNFSLAVNITFYVICALSLVAFVILKKKAAVPKAVTQKENVERKIITEMARRDRFFIVIMAVLFSLGISLVVNFFIYELPSLYISVVYYAFAAVILVIVVDYAIVHIHKRVGYPVDSKVSAKKIEHEMLLLEAAKEKKSRQKSKDIEGHIDSFLDYQGLKIKKAKPNLFTKLVDFIAGKD